jgi:hypothetical protein
MCYSILSIKKFGLKGIHSSWFRRHAPPAPARACGLCVGHRDRGLRSRRSFRHQSSAARLETAGGSNKALLDTGSGSIPGFSQSLARLLPPLASAPLSQCLCQRIRSACASLPLDASGPAFALPSAGPLRPPLARRLPLPDLVRGIPVPAFRRHPKVTLVFRTV